MSDLGILQKKLEMVQALSSENTDERSLKLREQLYHRYADICDAALASNGDIDIILKNKETFKVVCSDSVYKTILSQTSKDDMFKLVCMERDRLREGLTNTTAAINMISDIAKAVGYNKEVYSVAELKSALEKYKEAEVNETQQEAEVTNTETEDINTEYDDTEVDDLFNDNEYIDFALDESEPHEIDSSMKPEESEEPEESQAKQMDRVAKIIGERTPNLEGYDMGNQSDLDAIRAQIEAKDKAIQDEIDSENELKKRKEVQSAIKEETKDSTVDRMVVTKTVNLIMAVYDVMYAPLFQSTPSGVLTSAGLLTVKSDLSLHIAADGKVYAVDTFRSMQGLYGNYLRELDYHEEISIDCINPDGSLKYNYIPNMQVRNIYGIYRGQDGTLKRETNWEKFRGKLVKYLTKQVTNLMEHFPGDELKLSNSLVELFTTAYIAEDFDVNKSIKLLSKSIEIEKSHKQGLKGIGEMLVAGEAFPIDTTSLELVDNSPMEMGVYNLLLVMDKKQYNGEILFAYKPLQKIMSSGGSIGLKHTLLGRDIKGKNVTYNFESPQAVDSLIIAGSGSGKGVVTLNILATFIASGCPTVYVDWKPDMAAMLWNLERSTGAKILAIDGLVGRSDSTVPVRNYGIGINAPSIPSISDKLNCISYMKMFEIMVLCAKARNMNYNGMTADGPKMQFILDEAQAMNKTFGQLKDCVSTFLKDNKPTKERPETEEYKYVKRLNEVINSMFSGGVTFRNTTGRTGNTGLIMLGQQSDCTAWATGALKRDTFGFLVGNCSMKMLGKDAVDGTKYSLNGAVPKGNSFLGNMGYFAIIPQAVADKSDPDKIQVVKSYLVLNDNDYTENGPGKFTGGMLKNVTDPVIKETLINEDFYPMDPLTGKRYTNALVGFKGLIEYIGSNTENFNLNANLEAGYREVDKLLSGLGITGPNGRYSCIEEYVFDYSYDGLFTIDELSDLMQKGKTIASLELSDAGVGENDEDSDGFSSGANLDSMMDDEISDSFNTGVQSGVMGSTINKPQNPNTDYYDMSEEQKAKMAMGLASQANTIDELDDLMEQGVINESQKALRLGEMFRQQEEELENSMEDIDAEQLAEITEQNEFDKDYCGYLNVHQNRIDEIKRNIMGDIDDSVSDSMNMVAAMLIDSVNHGEITEAEAEAVARELKLVKNGHLTTYDFSDGKAEHIRSTQKSNPRAKVLRNGEAAMAFKGKNGRGVEVDTEKTKNYIRLDNTNSIDARLAGPGHMGLLGSVLMNTPKGAEKYMKNIWKSILDVIVQQGNPVPTISRVSLIGGQLSVNGKIVFLDGVIGGSQNIKLKEIVNFAILFKRFPMINELRLDEEMVQAALLELGDEMYTRLFNMGRKLQVVLVMERNGSVKNGVTRQNKDNFEVKKQIQQNNLRNKIDLHCKTISADKSWDKKNIADNVWGMKLAKGSFSNAGEAFLDKKKPRMGKAIFYTGAGVVIGTVGGLAWGLTKVGKGLFNLSGQFRR